MITKASYTSHDEWLALRRNSIGGSDAAAVIGLNPYKSKYALWAEKTGKVPGFDGNLITEVGSYLEQFVAEEFTRRTGHKVRRQNFTVFNDRFPWAHANVDRMLVGKNELLECKTSNSLPRMKLFKRGEYPEEWYCQVMHYMAVCGLKKAYIAVLIGGGRDFMIWEVPYDHEEAMTLMEAERAFIENHVRTNIPPVVSGLDCDTEAIIAEYPESVPGSRIQLYGREGLIRSYKDIAEQIKALESQKKEIQQTLCLDLGENETGIAGEYKVSWKSQTRNTFDSKRFAADHPQIDMSAYYKTTESRVFRIN